MTNNSTHSHHGRLYENSTIPFWGFNSSCNWSIAVQVDLVMSAVAVCYNLIILLLPLFISRMYCMQGSVISSYTLGAFLVSMYSAFFDSRLLVRREQRLAHEGHVPYVLIWFLGYHFMYHMHLMSWDQHHAITQFKAHCRFTSRSKLIKIILVVWACTAMFALLEAFFIFNPLDYPRQVMVLSRFRLIIVLTCMGFFWFGPLVLVTSWNATVFTFLLKVTQNGCERKTPPETTQQNNREVLPELVADPWNRRRDDDVNYEDPLEYATLPDDTKYPLSHSFANLVVVTTTATLMMIWFGYHIFAFLRSGKYLPELYAYKIVYSCELYLSLYVAIKFVLLLNPLWWFYYGREVHMCSVRNFGVPHHHEQD